MLAWLHNWLVELPFPYVFICIILSAVASLGISWLIVEGAHLLGKRRVRNALIAEELGKHLHIMWVEDGMHLYVSYIVDLFNKIYAGSTWPPVYVGYAPRKAFGFTPRNVQGKPHRGIILQDSPCLAVLVKKNSHGDHDEVFAAWHGLMAVRPFSKWEEEHGLSGDSREVRLSYQGDQAGESGQDPYGGGYAGP